jgi:hypothetical protein
MILDSGCGAHGLIDVEKPYGKEVHTPGFRSGSSAAEGSWKDAFIRAGSGRRR